MSKIKKVVSCLLLALTLIIGPAGIVLADDGQTVDFTFYSGDNANGYASGKVTNHFYHLTPGYVKLDLTTFSGPGTMYFTLYRNATFVDPSYGTGSLQDTGTINWHVDTDSTGYYLYIKGNTANRYYSGYGAMHDHQ